MLLKQPLQKQEHYNYSQSFSHMKRRHPDSHPNQFWLKKSIFNPSLDLEESYVFRGNISAEDIPTVDVIHLSKHWMLLQTPKLNRNFFHRLNAEHYQNPYQELLKIFINFTSLTHFYGFFKPTVGMIFTKGYEVKVWINEDIFSNCPMIELDQGIKGEKDFVAFFLAIVEGSMANWEKTDYVITINDTLRLLEWRTKISRGMNAVFTSKKICCKPCKSRQSMDPYQVGNHKKMMQCPSMEGVQLRQSQVCQSPSMNARLAIIKHHTVQNDESNERIFEQISNQTIIRSNTLNSKVGQFNGQIRKTKKNFNLSSTSSTLGHFSEKWRSTINKKTRNDGVPKVDCQSKEISISSSTQIISQVMSIQNELEGLFFDEEEDKQLSFGAEGNREELQRIAEEMEEVLIW